MTRESRVSFHLDECMKEPELPPSPLLNELSFQSVLGILEKYVNLASGWRKRFCVLQGGVLRYYKVEDGTTDSAILQIVERARENGDISLIGNELPMLERMGSKRGTSSSRSISSVQENYKMIPLGEIHLQIASVLDSQSGDSKRFTVHSGTKKLRFRAESELDKKAWMDALQMTKRNSIYRTVTGIFSTVLTAPEERSDSVTVAHSRNDSLFETQTIQEIRQRLSNAGATDAQIDISEEFMMDQHKFYVNYMKEEAEKRLLLIQRIRSLEEDKRLLEQQIVVQDRQDLRPTETGHDLPESRMSVEAISVDGSELGYESDDDVFYDCYPSPEIRDIPEDEELTLVKSPSADGAPSSSIGDAVRTRDTMYKIDGPLAMDANDLRSWLQNHTRTQSKRDRLPKPQQKEKKVGLWGIIKECIGKDLTKVCLPVYFNEPISALQKVSEELEYVDLLNEAIRYPAGSVERILYISAWAVSGYGGTLGRVTKPFNPLLGETFELVDAEKGYRFLGEKVVHHPTVFSLYCQGCGWEIAADTDLKSKFWGSSIELRPVGVILIKTHDGETYKLNKVTTSINNLIIGKLDIDHYGLMKVTNMTAKITGKIKFAERRLFSRHLHQVEGYFEDAEGRIPDVSLRGIWSSYLMADVGKGDGPFEIWRKHPPAVEPTRYNLSTFAIQLNELTDDIDGKVAPTDSRLRPDQRFLEKGMYDEANHEKQRLEHQQRAARKAAEKGDPIQPRWFKHVPGSKPGEQLTFIYKGGYWNARDRGIFEGCRDIFGKVIEVQGLSTDASSATFL